MCQPDKVEASPVRAYVGREAIGCGLLPSTNGESLPCGEHL